MNTPNKQEMVADRLMCQTQKCFIDGTYGKEYDKEQKAIDRAKEISRFNKYSKWVTASRAPRESAIK